jgi:excisionase family DNA binding protein
MREQIGTDGLESTAPAQKASPDPIHLGSLLSVLPGTNAGKVTGEGIGKLLLNVRETAQYLGLEVDTVYKKARLREVPCVKVGRALRFDVKALERFVERHTIQNH